MNTNANRGPTNGGYGTGMAGSIEERVSAIIEGISPSIIKSPEERGE
jgi:hypothetical protein